MLLHALFQRAFESFATFFQFWNIGRWWGWRGAQQLFENPLASLHWRGACWVRRHRQHCGHVRHAPARPASGVHFHKRFARDGFSTRLSRFFMHGVASGVGNAIKARQALVEECVIGGDQFGGWTVFANDGVKQLHSLFPHGLAKLIIEDRKTSKIGRE